MVILRDGRKLLGVFRSYDQFGMSSHPSHTTSLIVFPFSRPAFFVDYSFLMHSQLSVRRHSGEVTLQAAIRRQRYRYVPVIAL